MTLDLNEGAQITGVGISEIHGEPGEFEFLVHFAQGQEVGFSIDYAHLLDVQQEVERSLDTQPAVNMTFEEALRLIKKGFRCRREGWSGEGMFVFLVNGSNFTVNREPLLSILGEGTEVTYCPHIDIRTADGSISVWQPTMSDVLARDWRLTSKN